MEKLLPPLIAFIIRTLAFTMRFKIEDRSGITKDRSIPPILGIFWHNRMVVVPTLYRRYFLGRDACILTSPSRDGALLAGIMAQFRLSTVRGSSSRRGAIAMRNLITALESGKDVAITPDGPRGPLYKLNPGVVKIAQVTGTAVLPVHVHYSSYWTLKSWDKFRIPKPFSTVHIVLGPLHHVKAPTGEQSDPKHENELLETERVRLETVMLAGVDSPPS